MTDQTSSPRTMNDRYRLRRELATGGMATVYLADDLVLDRPVALKVLLPRLASDQAFVDRFRREAQSAGRLRHPNIVAVYDWGAYGESYCIAMEFVEGRTLDDILTEDGPLSPAAAARIAVEVAEALDAAHQQGLVHRDVKPGNIMVTPSGQVKITDFGIARAARDDRDLTQVGMIVGTASYLSPEQARGVGVDPRADLYALGVVLFEMVTGQRPFVGDSALAVAGHHVSTSPPRLRSVRPSLPPDLDDLVDRLLAKDPDDRYQSASRLAHDLRKIEGGGDTVSAASAASAAPDHPAAPEDRDDQRTDVMVPDGVDARSPSPPATEIMPDSIRPDRRPPVEARRPPVEASRRAIDTPRPSVEVRPSTARTGRPSGPSGLLLVIGALVVAGLFAAVLLLAAGIGSGSSDAPDDTTTTTAPTDQTTASAPDAEPVELPDLVGRSQSDAERALADLGLVARVEPVDVGDPSQAGQVVDQDPSAGQTLEPGSTVVIQVGRSATTTTAPTTTATVATTATSSTAEPTTSPSTSG